MSTIDYPLKKTSATVAPFDWKKHPFYESAIVLGIDIGIEGIGLWLRKGPKPIFAHTFLVSLPEAAPLKNRRQKRAWRHARQSRAKREMDLQKWIIRHGLLTPERLKEKWNNPAVFERAFEHRHRAITGKLGSPEALVVCIRHIVKHRGYDYHLTEEGAYPWGDELDQKEIIKWTKHAFCAPAFRASLLHEIESDASWAKDSNGQPTDKLQMVKVALDEAVKNYDSRPVEQMLENHTREKGHPNLRERARGKNFPRELIREHLLTICERHRDFFPQQTASFEIAMKELKDILDYHRRTPEEAEHLWLRKTKNCPFAKRLHEAGKISSANIKCDLRSDARVRRFNLLMFLAERGVELADNQRRVPLSQEIVRALLNDLEQDVQAVAALLDRKNQTPAQQLPGRPPKPNKTSFEKRFGLKLASAKDETFNGDFFDVLADHIHRDLGKLRDRASLCGESAEALYKLATNNGKIVEPAAVRQALRDCGYYDWRKDQDRGLGFYPQVEFLLGQRKHYTDDGIPCDVAKP